MGIPQASHRETLDHIANQPTASHDPRMKTCGCWKAKDGTYILCAYHDGYDEGIDIIKRRYER